jgi:hypothetical protein
MHNTCTVIQFVPLSNGPYTGFTFITFFTCYQGRISRGATGVVAPRPTTKQKKNPQILFRHLLLQNEEKLVRIVSYFMK